MRRGIGAAVVLVAVAAAGWAAAPPVKGARGFTKAQQAWLDAVSERARRLAYAGDFGRVEQLAREEADLRERVSGRDHSAAREARESAAWWGRLARLPADRRLAEGRAYEIT